MADQFEPVLQQAPSLRLGQGGMVGGGGNPNSPRWEQAPQENPTFNALMKIGHMVMAPIIEKRQNELFLEGATRVVQGEALKDIVDEQPAFLRIFGETASAQGARAVAQIAQVDKYNAALLGDMENLQQVPPEEIGTVVNQKMSEFLTGDPVADAAIQQKMVESSGTFYTAHAKNHQKFIQTNMQTQVTDMMVSSASMFQQAAQKRAEGTLSDKDWALIEQKAASSLVPIEGQTAESYWTAIETATVDALAQDNHHFVGMVFDSGLIDQAPSEVRVKLIDQRRQREAITRERAGYLDFGARIAMLKAKAATGQISPRQVAMDIDAMNKEFTTKYGIKDTLFSRDEYTNMISGNLQSIYRKQEANAKAAADAARDAQTEQAKRMDLVAGISSGLGNILIAAGHKKDDVHLGIYSAIETIRGSGGDWGSFVAQQYNTGAGHVNMYLQNEVKGAIRAATGAGYNGEAFDKAYQKWAAVYNAPEGKAAALDLLGQEDGIKMEQYHNFVQSGIEPDLAYQGSFGKPIAKGKTYAADEIEAKVDDNLDKIDPGWWGQTFGKIPMSKSARSLLSQEIGQVYGPLVNNLGVPEDEAVKRATQIASNRVDVLGAFAYRKQPDEPDFAALVGADKESAGALFTAMVAKSAKKQGVEKAPGITDIGPLGAIKKLIKGEEVHWSDPTPVGVIRDMWNKATKDDEVSTFISATPIKYDPETNIPYRTFMVNGVDGDGNAFRSVIDSRDVRKEYESSRNFSE